MSSRTNMSHVVSSRHDFYTCRILPGKKIKQINNYFKVTSYMYLGDPISLIQGCLHRHKGLKEHGHLTGGYTIGWGLMSHSSMYDRMLTGSVFCRSWAAIVSSVFILHLEEQASATLQAFHWYFYSFYPSSVMFFKHWRGLDVTFKEHSTSTYSQHLVQFLVCFT